MKTATVTYVAPIGDNKVVEMGGLTFFDGKSQEINTYDHPGLFQRLQGNTHFDFVMGTETKDETVKPPVKRGRPSNLDKAAAKAAADEAERVAKEAAAKAEEAKAVHEEISKDEKPAKADVKPVILPPNPSPPAA
jgi:hypothetical protein